MTALCVATTPAALVSNDNDWDNPMIDSVVMAHAWNPDSVADSVIAVAVVPDHHGTVPSWHCAGIPPPPPPPPPSRSFLPGQCHPRPLETSDSIAPRNSLDGPSVPPRPLNMDPDDTSMEQPPPLRDPNGSKMTSGHTPAFFSTRIKVGMAMVLVAMVAVAATLILLGCRIPSASSAHAPFQAAKAINATFTMANNSSVQNGSLAIQSTYHSATWTTAASNLTMAPTLNRTERGKLMAEFINGITLSNGPIRLLPPNSDQSALAAAHPEMSAEERALQWLVYFDSSTLTPNNPASPVRLQQRYALATLWLQLGWAEPLGPESECTWLNVACESVDLGPELGGGYMGVVTGLFLGPDVTTNFTLPPDLGLLTSLTQVEVLYAPLVHCPQPLVGGPI
jgi:hypothetical protein